MKTIKYSLLLFIFTFPAVCTARTIGSNIGIGGGGLRLASKENQVLHKNDVDKNAYLSIFYKYNWNINDFIFAVEFLYDYLNTKSYIDDNGTIRLDYRSGTILNIGYDIAENISVYTILGFGIIKYRAVNTAINYFEKKDDVKFRGLFGFGAGYDLTATWKISFEYAYQNINLEFHGGSTAYKFKNHLNTLKASIIYKF